MWTIKQQAEEGNCIWYWQLSLNIHSPIFYFRNSLNLARLLVTQIEAHFNTTKSLPVSCEQNWSMHLPVVIFIRKSLLLLSSFTLFLLARNWPKLDGQQGHCILAVASLPGSLYFILGQNSISQNCLSLKCYMQGILYPLSDCPLGSKSATT